MAKFDLAKFTDAELESFAQAVHDERVARAKPKAEPKVVKRDWGERLAESESGLDKRGESK